MKDGIRGYFKGFKIRVDDNIKDNDIYFAGEDGVYMFHVVNNYSSTEAAIDKGIAEYESMYGLKPSAIAITSTTAYDLIADLTIIFNGEP